VRIALLQASRSWGFNQDGVSELLGGAGELAEHERPRWRSNRHATYSLATRFMPSRNGVTSMTSAARYRPPAHDLHALIEVVNRGSTDARVCPLISPTSLFEVLALATVIGSSSRLGTPI